MSEAARDVIEKIKRLKSMGDLDPAFFAEEGGEADRLAQEFKGKLNPAQLRKIFGALKQIDRIVKADPDEKILSRSTINRLIPELAYALGRKLIPREFYELTSLSLSQSKLQTVRDFRRLMEFLTALVAYQKLRG